jgi:hypothetical protein
MACQLRFWSGGLGFTCRAQVAVWAAQQGLLEQNTELGPTER